MPYSAFCGFDKFCTAAMQLQKITILEAMFDFLAVYDFVNLFDYFLKLDD